MRVWRNIAERLTAHSKKGFSLIETLMALLILTIFSAMVAAAIPSVIRAYTSAVNASNAQAVLSTTTAALRDELGMALDVKPESSGEGEVEVTSYKDGSGRWSTITSAGQAGKSLVKKVGSDNDPPGASATPYQLIPDAAITDDLKVEISEITYKDGVFCVKGLKVKDQNEKTLASIESDDGYSVRAVGMKG